MKWFVVAYGLCTGVLPPEFANSNEAKVCCDGRVYVVNQKNGRWSSKAECQHWLDAQPHDADSEQAPSGDWTMANDPALKDFPLKNLHVACTQMGEQ